MSDMTYMQHCNEHIAEYYPDLADKTRRTFFNCVVIKSDKVKLVEDQVILDRPEVS